MQQVKLSDETLLKLISRIETVIEKLECKGGPVSQSTGANAGTSLLTTESLAASTDYWNKTIKLLLEFRAAATETGIKELEKLSDIVCEAVCAQQDIILVSDQFQKPQGNDLKTLAMKFSAITGKISEVLKENQDLALHVDAVKNGSETFYWLWSDTSCDEIAQTYFDSIDFPGNKILKKKVPAESKWLKAFKAVMKEIPEFVKKNYKKGLLWSMKGDNQISNLVLNLGNTYRKNFKKTAEEQAPQVPMAQIQDAIVSGEVKTQLKPIEKKQEVPTTVVTDSTTMTTSTIPTSKGTHSHSCFKIGRRETLMMKGKKEIYEEGRKVFTYQNIENEIRELDPDKLQIGTILQLINCFNCTFKIGKKINKIMLSSCEDVRVICDTLVSNMEIINSAKVKVQVDGVVNLFTVDGSKDVLLHLSVASAQASAYVSKSTDVKLHIVKENDPSDYVEYLIPEQYVHCVSNSQLASKVSELYQY